MFGAMTERTWKEVGKIVRSWRLANGWTQERAVQRAKRAGGQVSVANWRVFERGGRAGYRDLTLSGIAKAFGMPADAIERLKEGEDPSHLWIESTDWDDSGGMYDAARRVSVGDSEWEWIQEHPEQMRKLEEAILFGLRYLSVANRRRVVDYIVTLSQEEEGARLDNKERLERVLDLLVEGEPTSPAASTPDPADHMQNQLAAEKATKPRRKPRGAASREAG